MLATGNIVLLPFPFSNLSSQKKRPALVLTSPDTTGDFIALAITSRPTPFPAITLTNDDLLNGHTQLGKNISGIATPSTFFSRF